ncbi:MAG: VapE family protein [Pseudomonadota bacterium]|nr:VapE family protein [Pseudomonadota bacterium]
MADDTKVVQIRKHTGNCPVQKAWKCVKGLQIRCQYNELSAEYEVVYATQKYLINRGDELSRLRGDIAERNKSGLPSEDALETVLISLGRQHAYNPYKKFYTELPAVASDGVSALTMLFKANDLDKAMYRAFLEQMVRRGLEAGCHAPHMLVLKGEQGIGKSMLIRALATKDEWVVSDGLRAEDTTKILRKICGKPLCEVGEMNWGRADADRVKDLLSETLDCYDHKFKRHDQVPRLTLFVGSTNNDTPLPQDEQGRRFWMMNCESTAAAAKLFKLPDAKQRAAALSELERRLRQEAIKDLQAAKARVEDGHQGFLSLEHTLRAEKRYQASTYCNETVYNLLQEKGMEALKETPSDRNRKGHKFIKLDAFMFQLQSCHAVQLDMDKAAGDIRAWLKRQGCKYTNHRWDGKGKPAKCYQLPTNQ